MTAKELRQKLAIASDDMQVLISLTGEFDGVFVSPCMEESGVSELRIEEDSDETEKSFVLVRCGFFEEHDVNPELN